MGEDASVLIRERARDWLDRSQGQAVRVEDSQDGIFGERLDKGIVQVEICLCECGRARAKVGEDGLAVAHVFLNDQRLFRVYELSWLYRSSGDCALAVSTG